MAMRLFAMVLTFLLLTIPAAVVAQVSDAESNRRIAAAQADDAGLPALLQGAAAARLIGNHETAENILGDAVLFLDSGTGALINEMILQAMASGGGANGMVRAFREARETYNVPPLQIATLANAYPTLLTGGEFDEMLLRMRADHPNPDLRCACLNTKAWVYRVAGRMDESRELWVQLADSRAEIPVVDNPQAQGQYARDLARAGRTAEARRTLESAMAMDVPAEQLPAVQRRWAQAYAELGDVEGAVAQLEPLIGNSTIVTVNSLSTRYTWEPIRNHPAFQEMLARHH
jgi:tetratricopeptide (TPR) repeat protein